MPITVSVMSTASTMPTVSAMRTVPPWRPFQILSLHFLQPYRHLHQFRAVSAIPTIVSIMSTVSIIPTVSAFCFAIFNYAIIHIHVVRFSHANNRSIHVNGFSPTHCFNHANDFKQTRPAISAVPAISTISPTRSTASTMTTVSTMPTNNAQQPLRCCDNGVNHFNFFNHSNRFALRSSTSRFKYTIKCMKRFNGNNRPTSTTPSVSTTPSRTSTISTVPTTGSTIGRPFQSRDQLRQPFHPTMPSTNVDHARRANFNRYNQPFRPSRRFR